jgi:2-haloacid dehalogenase
MYIDLPILSGAKRSCPTYGSFQTALKSCEAMMGRALTGVKALVFDTWGTVVDWRSSILDELSELCERKSLDLDKEQFLSDWSAAYKPGKEKVNNGQWAWTQVSEIYWRALRGLLPKYAALRELTESELEHLNRAWTRTRPWPDSVQGLTRLKRQYVISTLSNGDFAWLVRIAKFAGLPFDCIITAENARRYKPEPAAYLTAVQLLGCSTNQVMMVAAHNYDLRAARELGMQTAFIPRPSEFGPDQTSDLCAEESWDVVARDLEDLAARLGA